MSSLDHTTRISERHSHHDQYGFRSRGGFRTSGEFGAWTPGPVRHATARFTTPEPTAVVRTVGGTRSACSPRHGQHEQRGSEHHGERSEADHEPKPPSRDEGFSTVPQQVPGTRSGSAERACEVGPRGCEGKGKRLGRQLGQRPVSDRYGPRVLGAIAEGRSNRWIAQDLGISKTTFEGIAKRDRASW